MHKSEDVWFFCFCKSLSKWIIKLFGRNTKIVFGQHLYSIFLNPHISIDSIKIFLFDQHNLYGTYLTNFKEKFPYSRPFPHLNCFNSGNYTSPQSTSFQKDFSPLPWPCYQLGPPSRDKAHWQQKTILIKATVLQETDYLCFPMKWNRIITSLNF